MTFLVNLDGPANTSMAGALFVMPEQEVILNLIGVVARQLSTHYVIWRVGGDPVNASIAGIK